MPGEPEPDSAGDASITTGHVIIAAMLGAFATWSRIDFFSPVIP
jgi:hypothetical protein